MCGICGTAGFADEYVINRMTAAMMHRGPDDGGVYLSSDKVVGLGSRRLSIIDPSKAGHMPMSNSDGSIWITYNGEIFNFPSLREELSRVGYSFRSRTDTEVLIYAYQQWGIDFLQRLNGMFAVALWDVNKRVLIVARDPFGIKPIYYSVLENKTFAFASEVKSLIAGGLYSPSVDEIALHSFLNFLWVPGPRTLFKNLFKLMPGHCLLWKDGAFTIQRYWEGLPAASSSTLSEPELVVRLRTLLTDSVRRHLISDVPLGVFLSGGLDSSAILALCSKITNRSMKTYTITYRNEDAKYEQSDEDAKYARLVARIFGADHHEIQIEPDVVDLLPKVVWHLDEPIADPAAISSYLICKAAREELTVLLSGQGGDEIFGGYHVHLADRLSLPFALMPAFVRNHMFLPTWDMLPRIRNHVPGVRPGKILALHRYFRKLLCGAGYPPSLRYVFHRSYYAPGELLGLYTTEFRSLVENSDPYKTHLEYFADLDPDLNFTDRMLFLDQKTFLPELNLAYSDKTSMAASVEVRVPLLDQPLAEFMRNIPAHCKIRGLKQKYLFKRAMEGILPHSVIWRRKAPFGAPIRSWLKKDLDEMVGDLLSEPTLKKRGYFDLRMIRCMIENDRNGAEDNTYRIWSLLTLEIWHRTFIDSH